MPAAGECLATRDTDSLFRLGESLRKQLAHFKQILPTAIRAVHENPLGIRRYDHQDFLRFHIAIVVILDCRRKYSASSLQCVWCELPNVLDRLRLPGLFIRGCRIVTRGGRSSHAVSPALRLDSRHSRYAFIRTTAHPLQHKLRGNYDTKARLASETVNRPCHQVRELKKATDAIEIPLEGRMSGC